MAGRVEPGPPESAARTQLAHYALFGESDVFAARRHARDAAAALRIETGDQVRIATAVSECGRVVVAAGLRAQIALAVEAPAGADGASRLIVSLLAEDSMDRLGADGDRDALGPARRLMDAVTVISRDPMRVEMTKACPPRAPGAPAVDPAEIRAALARAGTPSPLDELRSQNAELLGALEQLTAQQQELVRLNDELAETNRGVMAMYTQLSEEMEETNRGVLALYADLDERGAQLREANTAKTRFLASVSHELRSPLNSLLGLSALLLDPDSASLTPAQQRQVGLIRSSGQDLLGLVDDLLDVAKAEAGRLDPRFDSIELAGVFADLRATIRPLTRPEVELDVWVDPAVSVRRSDPELLSRCLRNLLSNAAKFTEAGNISLRADPAEGGRVRIEVADTGIGIAAEHRDLVFDEFYQVPGPLQVGVKGSGLGLAYARRVARALGGTLSLLSRPEQGTTFVLDLPADPPHDSARPPGAEADAAPPLRSALIVDDDEAMRAVLRGMLAGAVAEVAEAHDAGTAIEQMRALDPEVVLLDLRMAGGDGYQVLQRAGEDDALMRIPVVVLTSVEAPDRDAARLARAHAVLSKTGLRRDAVLHTMRDAVDAARRSANDDGSLDINGALDIDGSRGMTGHEG